MTLQDKLKSNLLEEISKRYSSISLKEASEFYWSPKNKTVYFIKEKLDEPSGQWTLLHELSHAKLNHTNYKSDFELLMREVAAWDEAIRISKEFDIKIDKDHVEACLDTYRDWLYARSTCPVCELNGLQKSESQYLCLNCNTQWKVSPSRFCRAYRITLKETKTPSE